MIDKWRKMSAGDRRKFQILIIFGLVGLYAPFYMKSSGQLFEAEKMLHRREDRIEKRASLDGLGADGPNVRTIEGRIEEVDKRLEQVSADLAELNAKLVPVDSNEAQQELMLAVSTRAERTGVRLLTISRINAVSIDPKGLKRSAGKAVERPEMEVTAEARFGELYNFLNALETLSYRVSVTSLKLYSKDSKTGNANPTGELYIQMKISL
ncbi:MAG: hypothetical protein Q7Q73_02160 [Verrucomicrobiota bacterium JB024]|nr:hypothetical protein [Verrucomicrobiota bacterium JB024]